MVGWKFGNSYTKLPGYCYTKTAPTIVRNPKVVYINDQLATKLGLCFQSLSEQEKAALFSGNTLPPKTEPLAQAYAGHQFGHFSYLGDGRAHLLGEHITPQGACVDIQFKGSGKTPYARRGDGRATLSAMMREYMMAEAMHALRVPTTRSLALVTTGEVVYREQALLGAVLTRVAASHLRFGTFEYVATKCDVLGLKKLAQYAMQRHYPETLQHENPYLALLEQVMERQVMLINDWLRIGFIHGVMNTDNMSISGETLDYGPCAFMDAYHPERVFSSIDHMGRYAYANQPRIAQWNLERFAETLLPLLDSNASIAVRLAEKTVQSFEKKFQQQWLNMMRKKLGLAGADQEDENLIYMLLLWMQNHQADYTNTFQDIMTETFPSQTQYKNQAFKDWYRKWETRRTKHENTFEKSVQQMRISNPVIIPRNHQIESALNTLEQGNGQEKCTQILAAFSSQSAPYDIKQQDNFLRQPPKSEEIVKQTFCGT